MITYTQIAVDSQRVGFLILNKVPQHWDSLYTCQMVESEKNSITSTLSPSNPCELSKAKISKRYFLYQQAKYVHTAMSFLIRHDTAAVCPLNSDVTKCSPWGEFRYIVLCVQGNSPFIDTAAFLVLQRLEKHSPFSKQLEVPLRGIKRIWGKR